MNKKKLSARWLIAVCLFGMAGTSNAATYSETYTSRELFSSPFHTSESWEFDLTLVGFDPIVQSVDSARIGLYFADDSRSDSSESAYLYFGSERETINIADNLVGWYYPVTLSDFTDLEDDGLMQMRLELRSGDFYFQSATLTVEAAVVPEPSTALLLGLGLMGVAVSKKRQRDL